MKDWLPVVVRFLLYLDLMALFGIAAFAAQATKEQQLDWTPVLPLRLLFAILAGVGVPLSILGLLMLAAGMTGEPRLAVDRSTIAAVLTTTAAGEAWLVRVTALGVVLAAAATGVRHGRLIIVTVLAAGTALATLAWSGHGAMGDGPTGMVHLSGDILHLLAASNWLGALMALGVLLYRNESEGAVKANRISRLRTPSPSFAPAQRRQTTASRNQPETSAALTAVPNIALAFALTMPSWPTRWREGATERPSHCWPGHEMGAEK